jgi:hypothetical protein
MELVTNMPMADMKNVLESISALQEDFCLVVFWEDNKETIILGHDYVRDAFIQTGMTYTKIIDWFQVYREQNYQIHGENRLLPF